MSFNLRFTVIYIYMCVCHTDMHVYMKTQFFYNTVLSLNNGGGQISLIILEMIITPNLHLEWLFTSLLFSPTFLLCSITAFSLVSFGLYI